MSDTNGARIGFLDTFKGVVIISVVLFHVIFLVPGASTGDVPSSPPLEFLYSGLMTLVVVSGMFYHPEKSYKENVSKRCMQLLLGYILGCTVLTSVMYVYLVALGYTIDLQTFVDTIWYSLTQWAFLPIHTVYVPMVKIAAGYYFINALFAAYLIFYAIADKATSSLRNFVIAVFLCVTASGLLVEFVDVMLPFNFHLAPMMIAFLLTGAYIRRTGLLDMLSSGKCTKRFWICTAVAFFVGAAMCILFPTRFNAAWMSFGDYRGLSAYPYYILNVCCGWVLLVAFRFFVDKIPVFRDVMTYVGKYTFMILLMHFFYAKAITAPFFELPPDYWLPVRPIWFSVLSSFVAIALSILTAILLKRIVEWIKKRRSSSNA